MNFVLPYFRSQARHAALLPQPAMPPKERKSVMTFILCVARCTRLPVEMVLHICRFIYWVVFCDYVYLTPEERALFASHLHDSYHASYHLHPSCEITWHDPDLERRELVKLTRRQHDMLMPPMRSAIAGVDAEPAQTAESDTRRGGPRVLLPDEAHIRQAARRLSRQQQPPARPVLRPDLQRAPGTRHHNSKRHVAPPPARKGARRAARQRRADK